MTEGAPERCLVIGGGLIGSHTALGLLEKGLEVTVLSRSFSSLLEDHPKAGSGLTLVAETLPGAARLDELVAATDVVLLLAGSSTPALSEEDAVASITGSLEPGLAVLEAVRRAGKERILLASSGGTIYGEVEQTPTPEDAPLRPISVHGVNSLALETYAAFYAREHGLAPITLRYSNVYGPSGQARSGQGVIAAWCAALSRGEPLTLIGDDSVRRDFVYAADAAEATIRVALGPSEPGVYNVGLGKSHSLAEVLSILAEVSGAEPNVDRRPGRSIDVSTTELDCSRLTDETGWRPAVDLREGVERTWRWLSRDGTAGTRSAASASS
jgi:UDP-glucose 4-epimerase